MHTAIGHEAYQSLASAWALLDRAEYLARQTVRTEKDPSLWLLAANSIARARDALEAIYPAAAHIGGVGQLFDGPDQALVQAAVEQLKSIPHGHGPEGLSLVLAFLAQAEHEVGGRDRR